ncbi:hypothetical protein GCM10009827_065910 [Dactylosporangium maewongense]|uniref:Tyr recombinase domain-containing protein n=1 Tax=Dactylosporangium maewongense TaxID=634393 RepID=A0ABN2BD12_9ACTN
MGGPVQLGAGDRQPAADDPAPERGPPDTFDALTWNPAIEAAGIERSRETGTHALRHYFASVLLDAGESIKALAEYLGHWDPAFTLRQYTHLMPASQGRTRAAIDRVFNRQGTAQ